jgi:nucleotide-binding universal stress UspA family protein
MHLKGNQTNTMNGQHPTNSILVAMDGSPSAKRAAEIAVYLAKMLRSQVTGLYVVELDLVEDPLKNKSIEAQRNAEEWSPKTTAEMLRKQGEDALAWLEGICLLEGLSLTTDIELGDVPEWVVQKGEKSDLVSLGRRGLTHAGDQDTLGPTFMSISHHLHTPMLIGGDQHFQRIERLLVAYNGTIQSQNSLHWSARLQRTLGAEISLLAIEENKDDPVDSWLEDAQTRLRSEKAEAEVFIHRGQPASEIIAAAVEHRSDLILMGHYRYGPLFEWLIGSTIDRVLRQTQLPVMLA